MSIATLARPSASRGIPANRRAKASTRSANSAAGYTACTKPMARACSASMVSPAIAIHFAQCGPTSRVNRLIPPDPGMTARFGTSGRPNVAASDASRKSHDAPSSTPTPMQCDWAASTTGKVVFCTGGSKGMGRDVAHMLAAEGCKVAIVDRAVTEVTGAFGPPLIVIGQTKLHPG